MRVIRFLFNLIWLLCGGLVMGLLWWVVGVLCCLSIVGIPFARSCFVIGHLTFWPFGQDVVRRQLYHKQNDIGTGVFGTIGNVIWFVLFGIWLAIGHLLLALAYFVTIIGIPFGLQHIKLAMLTPAPIGKTVVSKALP